MGTSTHFRAELTASTMAVPTKGPKCEVLLQDARGSMILTVAPDGKAPVEVLFTDDQALDFIHAAEAAGRRIGVTKAN